MKINSGVAVGLRKAIRLLGLTAGALLLCVPLFSQGNTGRILGTITDQTGGSVAGATVTVTDVQRGVSRALITDQAGEYSAPNLLPSTYTVRAEYKGFKSVERPNILLEVGKELRIDLTMQPGEITQTVTVTEQAPLLETTNAALGGTISNQTINELPLNGRNYENLLALRPGVTIYPGGGGWTQSTNGIRPEDNVYIVDGVNDNEPFSGMSVLNGAPLAGDASTSVPIDAIQEFNTQQNPKAEYGWKPGAIVNVGLKSGTNSLHGTAYAFGRDGAWDARDYFNYASAPECKATPAQCDKAPVAVEQFGATAGGPIKKDKLFFFVAYEGQRYNVGSIYPDKSPSLVAGAGVDASMVDTLSTMVGSGAAIGNPLNPISALSLNLAGCPTPLPTTPSGFATYKCTGQDLAGSAHAQIFPVNLSTSSATIIPGLISNNTQNNGLAKIDYHISDHHSLSGMYFFGQNDGTWNDHGNQLVPIDESLLYTRAQVGSGGWVWTPSSQWVNELRGGVDHLFQPTQGVDFNVNPATGYGINTGVTNPAYFGMPQIRIFSFGLTTFSIGQGLKKQQGPDDVFQLMDHVSYLRGNHAIKFGAEFIDNKGTDAGFSTDKGRIDFADLTHFFEGVPRTKTGGQILSGNPLTTVSSQGYALFVQDDWRIRPRVMINLGLRYELNTVLQSATNQLGNFLPNLGLVQVGKQISSAYNGDHNNFAPRLGIAWDVTGNGKTVVRAGGSIIYEVLPFNVFTALSNTLGLQTVPTGACLGATNIPCTTAGGTIAVNTVPYPGALLNWNGSSVGGATIFPSQPVSCLDSAPCAVMAINPNLRTPYVSTWIVGVQRAITNSLSVDASYIGNHGTKLIGFTDMNQPKTSGGALPFATQFPYLSYINQLSNLYLSNYNGLQVTLTQRISHGLSFVAGYTYSHALDDSSHNWEGGIPLNSYQPKLEYASSDFDIRNRFTLSVTYDIPGVKSPLQLLQGWEINSIVTLQGGQPWGPSDLTNDFSGTGEVSNPSAVGEWWNFFGNRSDFTSNQNPIPFFGSAPFPAACTAHAALADLNSFGCYMKGNSVLVPPAAGTYGNSGRGIFRDQGFRDWDFSVIKGWKLQERLTAQFRAEFFNILNHPIFTNPYGGSNGYGVNDPSSPGTPAIPGVASQVVGFGCGCATPDTAASNPVLGSGSSRAIQLGLKLIF